MSDITALENAFNGYNAKVVQLSDFVNDQAERLDQLEIELKRPRNLGGDGLFGNEATAERRAFTDYLRHGIERMTEPRNVLVTSNDPGAGYLAPPEYQTTLDKNLVQFSPIRSYARVGTTSAGAVLLPKRTAAPTGYWVGEIDSRTSSEPTYGLTSVPLGEIAAYCDISNRNLEDAAFDLAQELANDFAEAFSKVEGLAFISGDGTKQRPEGILTVSGIASVVSGAGTAITGDGLINTLFALPAFYRSRATWAANGTTIAAIRKLKDGQGQYLLTPGLQQGAVDMLLGRPIIEAPDMPDIGASAKAVILGDWSKYRIFDHANSWTLLRDPFSQAGVGVTRFHARKRVGATCTLAEAFRVMTIST